ncbi:hypothetical protein KKG83_03835 [Candidatus Micrarchaeota archaeon]|nr:hypothetical protein [Candidatus Micrarchaeota archaeon]MBU2476576.1 hypothetical protein [Candidatus Micrarchaeota archaeon]
MNETMNLKTRPQEQKITDVIIDILSNEFPLTVKQVYIRLKRNHGVNVSYQAVHKHIKQMIENKVLSKDGNDLFINYSWIKKLSNYAKSLESAIGREKDDGSRIIILDSFVACGQFLINDFMGNETGKYQNPENKDCVCMWNHAWPIVGASQEEHEKMKKMFSKTIHWNVCAQNTFLDKVTANYVAKIGKKVVLNQKGSMNVDTFTEGDYIMQVHLPEKLKKDMHQLYMKVKSEKDFDMKEMLEFGSKNYGIRIVIFKNKQLADSLREEAKKIYEESLKEKRK